MRGGLRAANGEGAPADRSGPTDAVWPSAAGRAVLTAALAVLVLIGLSTPAVAAESPRRSTTAVATPVALTFATYNVCKATCKEPAPSWSARRERLARVIAALGADVVGLQEATELPVGSGVDQWQDIRRLTAAQGFVAPHHPERNDTCSGRECTHTARLLYRASTVAPVHAMDGSYAAGYAPAADLVDGLARNSATREIAWAYLRPRSGGGPFLALSMHLASEKDARTEGDRARIAAAIVPWAARLSARTGIGPVPIVLLGDLNSFDRRQPTGAQAVLRATGWSDAWRAPRRANLGINSTNYSPTSRSGWPARPIRNASGVASRVDYVMFHGPGVIARSYRVVVWLESDGTFAEAFRASDHNPVRARLVFTASTGA